MIPTAALRGSQRVLSSIRWLIAPATTWACYARATASGIWVTAGAKGTPVLVAPAAVRKPLAVALGLKPSTNTWRALNSHHSASLRLAT